jgi:hypothetical protein
MADLTYSDTLAGTPGGRRHPTSVSAEGGRALAFAARSTSRRTWWFALLVGAVCFEGLGRKLFPDVPSAVFYYSKDVVLLLGLARFGVAGQAFATSKKLFRGFLPFLALAIFWTIAEAFNPAQPSLVLAGIGIRAYWLWWIAPIVVANAVRTEEQIHRALGVLAVTAFAVAGVAAVQFGLNPDSELNAYARYGGETILSTATVASTGRARVSSTFAYLTGFSDFITLVPQLLLGLALGLGTKRWLSKWIAITAAILSIASIPFSGSRAPLMLTGVGVLATLWSTGLATTRLGRRVLMGLVAAVVLAVTTTPDAVQGLLDRFGGEDTESRILEIAQWLPPVALASGDYAPLGDGTGTQQNARLAFAVDPGRDVESETSRTLAELGAVGYLLVWVTRCGLILALVRAYRLLRNAGKAPVAGVAIGFAAYAMLGSLIFDHVSQALFFIGLGLILASLPQYRIPDARTVR